jgi:hypothetical protein
MQDSCVTKFGNYDEAICKLPDLNGQQDVRLKWCSGLKIILKKMYCQKIHEYCSANKSTIC